MAENAHSTPTRRALFAAAPAVALAAAAPAVAAPRSDMETLRPLLRHRKGGEDALENAIQAGMTLADVFAVMIPAAAPLSVAICCDRAGKVQSFYGHGTVNRRERG